MKKNNISNIDFVLESNIPFFKKLAHKYPQFYKRPLLEKEDGEAFLATIHKEYELQSKISDPLPKITLNAIENTFIAPEQNVTIHKLPAYIPAIMHFNEYFELKYIRHGQCIYYTSDKKLVLNEGDIILTPPNIKQGFSVEETDEVFNILIRSSTFDTAFFQLLNQDDFLADFFSRALYGSPADYVLWHQKSNYIIENLIERCYSEFHSNIPYTNRMIDLLIMEFFVELLRTGFTNDLLPEIPTPDVHETIKIMMHYLQKNYANASLSDVATICNYSERQLSRIIKEQMGSSFIQLRSNIRLEKACLLLQQRNLREKEIAITTGFGNKNYFRKVFQQKYGVTPMDYHKRYTSKQS